MFASTWRYGSPRPSGYVLTSVGLDSLGHGVHFVQAFVGTQGEVFDHFIPLATSDGRLVVHPVPLGEMAIVAGGNTTRAFELLLRMPEYVLEDRRQETDAFVYRPLPIPITRAGYWPLEHYLERNITRLLETAEREYLEARPRPELDVDGEPIPRARNFPAREDFPQLVDDMITRLMAYLHRPLAMTLPLPARMYHHVIVPLWYDSGLFIDSLAFAVELEANMDNWWAARP